MKTIFILTICLILSTIAFGQNETKQINRNVEEVKVTPPKFTGVENASVFFDSENNSPILNYLTNNFVCPREVGDYKIEGTEIIEFTVTPNGRLTNFKVINSVNREIDKQLISILQRTNGMWLPGYNNGEPTAMEHEVSLLIGEYSQEEIVKRFVKQAEKYFKMGGSTLFVDQKPRKALKYFNKSVRYLPNDKSLLLVRGMCNYELGNKDDARKDWNRVVSLGGIDINRVDLDIADMSGYSEMSRIFAQKYVK